MDHGDKGDSPHCHIREIVPNITGKLVTQIMLMVASHLVAEGMKKATE